MKVRADRDTLSSALAGVSRIATTRSVVRVLACVRLSAEPGRLTLTTTDTELSCRSSVAVEVTEGGEVAVPAVALLDVVRNMQGAIVTVTSDPTGNVLHVTDGQSDYTLNTASSLDFPAFPTYAEGLEIDVDRSSFLETLARVVRAASTDASRPVYTGVRLTIAPGEVTVAATDGYRLATKTTALRTSGEPVEALVPARALQELARLKTADDSLRLKITTNLIAFEQRDVVLTSRRLDGAPQSHEHILAAAFTHHARLGRQEVLGAVNRAAVIVQRNAPLELSFTETELHLRVHTAELGEANERVKLTAPGPTIRIGFNLQFLRDGLELVEGDDVWFKMNDGIRPAVLHGQGDDFAYLLAPQRLPDNGG